MIKCVFLIFVLSLTTYLSCLDQEDKHFWDSVAKEELDNAIKVKWNLKSAKNVIIFIGDGMGVNTVTAARLYKGGERSKLHFETFPHVGLLKTYNTDKQVPDSGSTATAMFSGVKTNFYVLGLESSVKKGDCPESLQEKKHLDNLFNWAFDAGKRIGIVTTTRVTHATPAAAYAHCPDRRWECESKIPEKYKERCKDIARQLMEDRNGRKFNVIMGGGRQCLVSNATTKPHDPIDSWACYRSDGRDLIHEWVKAKDHNHYSYEYVSTSGQLDLVNNKTDFLLGIFANGHMNYDYERDRSADGMPSLQEMTAASIKVLNKGHNGFVLMVEGGLIDFAHHRGYARIALDETVAFDNAINWTISWLDGKNMLDETLVIVAADHDHGLIINGYPNRGNNILDIAETSKMDATPYTTLTYGTGGVNNYQFTQKDGKIVRKDPSKENITDFKYSIQSGILQDEVKHGGGDVVVYAKGPMAHLFHSVHEQNYVAYVVAYAAKIGPYKNGTVSIVMPYILIVCLSVLFLFFCNFFA